MTFTKLHIGQENVLGFVAWFNAPASCGRVITYGQFPALGEGPQDDLTIGQFCFQRQGAFSENEQVLFDIGEIDGVPVAINLRQPAS